MKRTGGRTKRARKATGPSAHLTGAQEAAQRGYITPTKETTMTDQFWLPKRYAETKRLAPGPHFGGIDQTGLRVYQSDPDGVTVQWRVQSKHKPYHGTITNGRLTWDEAAQLRDYLTGLLQIRDFTQGG